jgi:CheY-like chemotaxis protein
MSSKDQIAAAVARGQQFPRERPGEHPAAANKKTMPIQARILVVEDDLDTAQSLSALLEDMGHAPTLAERGEDALALLANTDVDLIISDVLMPGMSGLDFAKRVRDARPNLPIVMVTGDAEAMESVLASGAVALLKPYSAQTLGLVLAETLDDRSA